MMMNKWILGLAVLISSGSELQAKPVVNTSRAAVIEGVISGNNLSAVEKALQGYLAESASEPVDLIINSPGGSVTTGFLFISKLYDMKARGLRLRCFVPQVAASMAFQTLLHCDEKYVLERSFLLWHRVRISVGGMFGAPLTAPEASYLALTMQRLDDQILEESRTSMPGIPADQVEYHFERETLHTGLDLHKMDPSVFTVYKQIDGLFEALDNKKIPRSQSADPFGVMRGSEIIYMSDRPELKQFTGSN